MRHLLQDLDFYELEAERQYDQTFIRRIHYMTYASSPTCRRERPGSASDDDEGNADGREEPARSSAPAALGCGAKAAHGAAARRATAKNTAATKRCMDAGDPRGALILPAILQPGKWVHVARRLTHFIKKGKREEGRRRRRKRKNRPCPVSPLMIEPRAILAAAQPCWRGLFSQ